MNTKWESLTAGWSHEPFRFSLHNTTGLRLLFVGLVLTAVFPATGAGDDDKGTMVDLGGLHSRAPADWKAAGATNRGMRAYEFALPKADDDPRDASLVIFYFGPRGAGSAADNIKRWKAMFEAPEGKSIDDVAKSDHFKTSHGQADYFDVEGIHKFKERPFDPNAEVERRPNSRMLAVILPTPKGPYYIRLVGPAKTVAKHKPAFDEWVKAFR